MKKKWVDVLGPGLKTYNSRAHGTTGRRPINTRKEEHRIQVYSNMRKHAQYKISCPKLSVG